MSKGKGKGKDPQRQQELDDLTAIMETAHGRRFVWGLLEQAGVFQTSFAVEQSVMCYREGRRSIGLALLADIDEACPEQYRLMLDEARRASEESKARG